MSPWWPPCPDRKHCPLVTILHVIGIALWNFPWNDFKVNWKPTIRLWKAAHLPEDPQHHVQRNTTTNRMLSNCSITSDIQSEGPEPPQIRTQHHDWRLDINYDNWPLHNFHIKLKLGYRSETMGATDGLRNGWTTIMIGNVKWRTTYQMWPQSSS